MNLPILTLCCALTIAEPQEINIPTQTIANCVEQCYNNCSEIVEDALEKHIDLVVHIFRSLRYRYHGKFDIIGCHI